MASRIKGITVEIGGDTSGLERSLNDVSGYVLSDPAFHCELLLR